MMSYKVSGKKILLFLFILCLTRSLFSQVTSKDTIDYVPEYYNNALEYNLMIAASKGLDTEVERLILRGAEIDAETEEGATALVMAVVAVKSKCVNVLLSYSADPNKKTAESETPLLITLKKLVDLETSGFNLVTASREASCLEIAESLLRYGADIDFQDDHGATALNYASIYGSFRFADLLLYYRADIDRKAFDGTTPLMAAIWAGHANIADLLIQNGANMEARDDRGFTPLLIAAQNGDTLLLDYLIKRGVDIYERDQTGWDALSLSIKYDHRDAASMLIKAGAGFREPGKDALNYYNVAVKYNRDVMFELLEKNNFPDKYKPQISQMELSLSAKFTFWDIYTGMNFIFREPRKNIGFLAGFDTKLWYTSVLVNKSDGLYYQYQDKSSLVYAGVFKDLLLTDNPLKSNFIISGSLSAGYWFGNKFKGTETMPAGKFRIIPAVAIKLVKRNFSIYTGFEYMNTDFVKTWPVWCRTGISYNFDFKHGKTPVKIIKWY
jgi:ankyrin repeat protein